MTRMSSRSPASAILVHAVIGGSRRMVSEEAEIEATSSVLCLDAAPRRTGAGPRGSAHRARRRSHRAGARELDARLEAAGADLPSPPAAPLEGARGAGRIRPVTLSQAHAILRSVQEGSARSGGTDPVNPPRRLRRPGKPRQPYRLAFAEPGQNQCTGAGVGPGDPPCCRAGSGWSIRRGRWSRWSSG